jgi:hypothetical protein
VDRTTLTFGLTLRSFPLRFSLLASLFFILHPSPALYAQDRPYFVTYSDSMEEPGNLEIETQFVTAAPKNANAFFAPTVALEYGVTAWWTTEVYFQGQATQNDSAVFTGFRFENRFRPLAREYWINPVIYVEYEDVNGADKSFLEVVGHDTVTTLSVPNSILRAEVEHAIEGKLILSGNGHGINFSGNFIAEKAVNEPESWEFGYALAASRPLALKASSRRCTFCRQNIAAGAELFGGLGERHSFGLNQTAQYAGPVIALNTPNGFTYKFSPEFGLNDNAATVLWRFGVNYEISQIRDWFRRSK